MLFKKWPAIDFSKPRLILAPMEGVVDAVNRRLISSLGATDLCVTEFIRVVDHLLPAKIFHQYCPELTTKSRTPYGTPVLVQLLGSHAQAMAENAARAMELGAIGIDLNFGCPAKTVNRSDGGAALLKTPERIFQIVEAVRKAVPATHSVSAKIRLGFDNTSHAMDIAQAAEDAGASWLTVHARTKVDGYKPPAYWEHVAPLREKLKIPVIANGEVWTREDYLRCQKISTCDHVMIGRGWVANPGIGLEIKNQSDKIPWLGWQNYFLDFFAFSMQFRHEQYAIQRTKQLSKMMSQSYGEAHLLLQKIKIFQTAEPILEILRYNFLDQTVDKSIPEPKLIIAKKFNAPKESYAENSNLHEVLLPVL